MLAKLMPKRLVLFFLIFILFNVYGAGLLSGSAPIKSEKSGATGYLKNNITIASCLLAIMFLGVYQAQIDQMPESLKSQFKPENLALNFASTYCMNFACTFFHELGHGIAKKILTGSDFKIHLGNNSADKNFDGSDQSLINSKYISIDGFDPMSGFNTLESHTPKKYTSSQKILINLAGGVSGILGYYLLRTALFFIYNLGERENKTFLQNFQSALSQSITFDQIVLNQLFNMLVPMKIGQMQKSNQFGGDAARVWQELGIKNSVIQSVADIQPYLQMLAFIALSFKQSDSKDQRYIADKVLIGLANYFLQGFAQFKSA